MADNSDYTKPYTKLFELLPEVYKSDANKSLFANLFDRYLTKQETERVAGYVGEGNTNALISRQIHENDIHRQAYQLQPILYNKVGSVEWMASWKDILNEAERQGIEENRIQEWMALLKFNWAPPIDIDKLIHYQDYYWYDEDNAGSLPQYITIRSRCTTANAKVSFHQRLIDENGIKFEIIDLQKSTPSGEYDIIVINGDYTYMFEPSSIFYVSGSTNNGLNKSILSTVISSYDDNDLGRTYVRISTSTTSSTVDGFVIVPKFRIEELRSSEDNNEYDTIVIGGDYSRLLETGFTFYITESTNIDLNDSFWTVEESQYYSNINKTYVKINTTTLDPTADGFASLSEYLAQLEAEATCICETTACGEKSVIPAAAQWIDSNKWLHKVDVPNFSIAKQAEVPIIEYDWDLELNEWTYTQYQWKYRSSNAQPFSVVSEVPDYIEYASIDEYGLYQSIQNKLELDEKYGDLTGYFIPGRKFMVTTLSQILEVELSEYISDTPTEPNKTVITLTEDFTGFTGSPSVVYPLRPLETSRGDSWLGQNEHWLLTTTQTTLPVVHQPETEQFEEDFIGTPTPTYTLSDAAIPSSTRTLRTMSLVGTNNVRVYVDGIRQYGTYIEETEETLGLGIGSPRDTNFVAGITFLTGYEPAVSANIKIQVGESAISDIGKVAVPVRTIEDDIQFAASGVEYRTLITYRKEEQIKTQRNQYPLFDLYKVDGTPAFKADNIFKFASDPNADVNIAVGQRLKTNSNELDYVFEQSLVEEDDGILYAYRHYFNQQDELWVDPSSNTVYFWDETCWSTKVDVGNVYRSAYVGDIAPTGVDGLYWLDTLNNVLKVYDEFGSPPATWEEVPAIYQSDDPTLQTIWKKGLNDEKYVPVKRDEKKRTEVEYKEQEDVYVQSRVTDLTNTGSTPTEALATALDEWTLNESTHLSQFDDNGNLVWAGDWELPDPLYYNNSHQNRKEVSVSEIVTHFSTIIDEQPKVPGYVGTPKAMFHMIPMNEINFGVGGKIREYLYGFDTFLSALFVNEVSPRSLINFGHDQYEVLINYLKEFYRSNVIDLLSNTSYEALVDLSSFVSTYVINILEQNDQLSQIYGDSTTFIDNEGTNDLGVRNWIATLPFLCLSEKHVPIKVSDPDRGLNHIVHHDGHREDYFLEDAVVEGIRYGMTLIDDPRSPTNKLGVISTSQPPNTVDEFETYYGSSISGRDGVYWYHADGTTRVLYRLSPLSIGVEPPADDTPDGTTWIDLNVGQEALRLKSVNEYTGEVEWLPPAGIIEGDSPIKLHDGVGNNDTSTISAWTEIDVNELLRDVVFEVERRLYEAVPTCSAMKYDYDELNAQYPVLYNQYLEEQYLAFAREREITVPYSNVLYSSTNAFTWNYKYSTHGSGFQIVDIDTVNDAFVIEGDFAANFPPGAPFFIKNNGPNDGTWTVVSSTYDTVEFTTILVTSTVQESVGGVIYSGLLPSSTNDGSESGGDWRDLYSKFYNTPFPHLEPWKLQGYDNKPTWWDEEYLNDEPLKWGNRRWKYKHGFEINSSHSAFETFKVTGDFREVFLRPLAFAIDGGTPNDGVWTVDVIAPTVEVVPGIAGTCRVEIDGDFALIFQPDIRFSIHDNSNNLKQLLTVESSYFTGPPTNQTVIYIKEGIVDDTGYDFIGGSTYDVSTNQTTIHVVENVLVDVTNSGRITLPYGMWHNITLGIIPPGQDVPAVVPTYNYVSVNIGNHTINSAGEYNPDEVFPPFWDYSSHFGAVPLPFDMNIRSLYYQFSNEIVSPSADYVFGDAGPYEWLWRESSQYLYDQMIIAFRLDPIRFIHTVFGSDYYSIDSLLVDKRSEKVLTHVDVDFHGDLVDNQPFKVDGINQWYVNYLRYLDYDISMSDFRAMWSNWTAPMMYQFSSFIDTPSLDIGHRQICVSDFDYRIAAKRSPGVEDYWLDSFNIDIITAPPKIARGDNEHAWKLSLTTKTPFTNSIDYYDVQNYQFYADPNTDLCTLFSWSISAVSFFNNTFSISGDQTYLFLNGKSMEVVESSDVALNTTYTVEVSTYDSVNDVTLVQVQEFLPTTVANDGRIILDDRKLPWQTGENITLTSHGFLPTPLQSDNVNGVYEYFIIRVTDNTFRLATTHNAALSTSYVDITSGTRNDLFVGKIYTTFEDSQHPILWRHYVLDKTTVRSFIPPYEFDGLQTLINIIDGYEEYTTEIGWRYNIDNTLRDPSNTAYAVNWQHELVRFLEFSYKVRVNKTAVADRHPTSVDETTNIWTFVDESQAPFITGEPVTLFSSNQIYPTPLVHGGRYYMIRDSISEYRLAATKKDAMSGVEIDIIDSSGTKDLALTTAKSLNVSSSLFEINPFRNAIWFRPERGIVSNLLKGPTDSFSSHVLVDQYGRAITSDVIRVYREDKETKITVAEGISNDVELTRIYQDPYNFIHLGGAHLFVDTYEHVVIFNGETTAGQLLYDSFLGLNLTKFEMLFNRQTEFTQRPNVGGQYLSTFFNQGADLDRNIEASIEDLRNLYDTYRVIEANDLIAQGRKSIGYVKEGTYFDNMNLNDKSQFVFWRGQIQNKGAMTSVQSFVNSRRFIDAKIDEFWAVKVGEFGSGFGNIGSYGNSYEKEYIELWLTTDDVANDDIYLDFLGGSSTTCNAGYAANPFDIGCGFDFPSTGADVVEAETGWSGISVTDQSRWYNYPDQQSTLQNNAGSIYFDLTPAFVIPISIGNVPFDPVDNEGWIDTVGLQQIFKRWNDSTKQWDQHGTWDIATEATLRHGMESDLTTITATVTPTSWATYGADSPAVVGYYEVSTSSGTTEITIPEYVIETGMIKVFRGMGIDEDFVGVELEKGVGFAEEVENNFLSDKIYLTEATSGSPAETIRVIYGSCTFTPEIHYTLFNTTIVKFLFEEMTSNIISDLKFWGWILNKDALNPHSIIDVKSDVVVTRLQVWDPARGWNYYNADHIIDLKLDIDPAFYGQTLITDERQLDIISKQDNKTAETHWSKSRVGTTYLDTKNLDYVPYYDPAIIPRVSDRLLVWGQLADWSKYKIYTWIESDVHPEEWNDIAITEEIDSEIPQQLRKSGRSFKTTFVYDNDEWIVAENVHTSFDPIIDDSSFTEVDTTFQFDLNKVIPDHYTTHVFVNGQVYPETEWDLTGSPISTLEVRDIVLNSRVELVHFAPGQDPLLDEETNTANLEAALTTGSPVMFRQEYQYSVESYIDSLDQERSLYYFWVEDKATKGNKTMSPINAQSSLENFPIPYVAYQDVQPGNNVDYNGEDYYLPPRFQRAILRGLRTIIDDNDRYVVRWLRDFTLRDSLPRDSLDKKDQHEEWQLIRREMPYQVPRWLWDKMVESIVGYLLTDSSVRVPTLERELYDIEYDSDTQYGIGDGQTFTDGTLALETIVSYLNDPDNDFYPININIFFSQHNFDSNEAIIDALDNIYNNFPYLHVNAMFFDTLLDALSKKTKYEGIFKTSMIAVHGIRPIEVSGVFDD